MLPDPQFCSLPSPSTVSAAPTDRASLTPSVDKRLPVRRPASFSEVAAEHSVTPTALDDLLEHLPVGLWIADRDGRVVFANEAARALGVDQLETLQWAVTRALLTEEPVHEDAIEIVVTGQKRRWVSAHVMPVRVAGVGVTAAFVTLSDVTARNRMRQWDPVIESLVNL
jgi:PAS domain-containing protein